MFDESTLIKGCIARDKKAWNLFVERFSEIIADAIHKSLRKSSFPSNEHFEDVFHTVFVALLDNDSRKIRQFKWRCKLSSWLYIVAANVTFDYLRKFQNRPELVSLDNARENGISLGEEVSSAEPSAIDILEIEEEKRIIGIIRKRLTNREQLYLKLSNDYELPARKIAAILNITANNVYQLKSVIMTKMKKMAKKII